MQWTHTLLLTLMVTPLILHSPTSASLVTSPELSFLSLIKTVSVLCCPCLSQPIPPSRNWLPITTLTPFFSIMVLLTSMTKFHCHPARTGPLLSATSHSHSQWRHFLPLLLTDLGPDCYKLGKQATPEMLRLSCDLNICKTSPYTNLPPKIQILSMC